MSEEAIFAALQIVNAEQCVPPLPDGEVRAIAHSVGRYTPASPAPAATTEQAASSPTDDKQIIAGDAKPKPPSQSTLLVGFTESAEVFCSDDGETAYATVTVNGHQETWPVKSRGFRRWLGRCFYEQEKKPPTTQAMQEALGIIEGNAYYGAAPRHGVYTRLAEHDGAIYLDLANAAWEVVKITGVDWQVVQDCPVKFRRPKALAPLPTPVSGGTLEEIRGFVNVRDDAQWALLAAWLVAAARPIGPYPVLVLGGEHGTAKSTTAAVLRRLIDPSTALLRAEPKEMKDVVIAATNGWVVNLDNLSAVPAWLSDCICRISTGGGLSARELYSDDGEVIFNVKRPVILNSIEEIATRSDLLDRSLLLTLPVIPEEQRRTEGEFWPLFDAAHPRLLGALLDVVSTAMKRVGSIHLGRLPRMADFAQWATAAEPGLGWADGRFMSIYTGNIREADELALDASVLAGAIRDFTEPRREWEGTATELLEELNRIAPEPTRRAKGWPLAAHVLTSKLRRLAPNLRAFGIEIELPDRRHSSRRRLVTIKKGAVDERPERPQGASPAETKQESEDLDVGAALGASGAVGAEIPTSSSPVRHMPLDPDDPLNDRAPELEEML
jgi:hypothetical protein